MLDKRALPSCRLSIHMILSGPRLVRDSTLCLKKVHPFYFSGHSVKCSGIYLHPPRGVYTPPCDMSTHPLGRTPRGHKVVSTSACVKFSHLILAKIMKFVATRCQILRLKCTKFNFGWGSAPDTAGELTALPQTCLLYTSPSPRDRQKSRMPSSA